MNSSFTELLARWMRHSDLIVAFGIFVIVSMLILPMPEWMLDTALVINIAASVVIALVTVNIQDTLQFSVFPSVLLLTTLFRIALSIAATKLILGSGSAGQVIETFGSFVVGGNFVVGLVAFIILVIVQFVVITGGAGRVAEVAARFALDAMPGKQMAIDADLNAGLIDEKEARRRRKIIQQESEFHGAMDGASKFVRGDAIAAIVIMLVNVAGGFAIGYLNGQGDALTVLKTYTLLTVGEGLVSQIPALMISTSTGLMVTRVGAETSMGRSMMSQLMAHPRALGAAGGALVLLGFVPGFPMLTFFALGGMLGGLGYVLAKNGPAVPPAAAAGAAPEPSEAPPALTGPEAVMPLLNVDPIEYEFGYALMPLVDPNEKGDLIDRISGVRRQLAMELGFVMPSVRVRDNMQLRPNEYVVKIRGEIVARGDAMPRALLAMDSSGLAGSVPGTPAKEPVFGLDALWIDRGNKELAERSGYAVIEPAAMVATHLTEVVKNHAAELLSRQDVQALLDHVKETNRAVVEELTPNVMTIGDVQKVLQHLLRERVPIRDLVTIFETLADFGTRTKDTEQLGELVRCAINRTITRQYSGAGGMLRVITLDPRLEQSLQEAVQQTAIGSALAMDPREAERFLSSLQSQAEQAAASGEEPILVCSHNIRLPLRKLLERSMPTVAVISYNEVAPRTDVEQIGQVSLAS